MSLGRVLSLGSRGFRMESKFIPIRFEEKLDSQAEIIHSNDVASDEMVYKKTATV